MKQQIALTVYERFYVSRILQEVTNSNTYSKSLQTLVEINKEAIKFSYLFDTKIEESKQLPSMYWIPKMLKNQLELDSSLLPKMHYKTHL